MPSTVLKYCAEPLCTAKVTHGRCALHSRQVQKARGTSTQRGYGYRWQVRAARFLTQFPLCGMRYNGLPPVMSQCRDEHRLTEATQVDHVVPHRGDQALFWDELGNWQALCASCGAKKSKAGL